MNRQTLEIQLTSMVEELTQDDKGQLDGQLSIFSGLAQNQVYDNLNNSNV